MIQWREGRVVRVRSGAGAVELEVAVVGADRIVDEDL